MGEAVQAVERLLTAFWARDAEAVAKAVTEDFRFINMPFPHRPLIGRAAIKEVVARGNLGFPARLEDCNHEIFGSFEIGPRVMNERVDRFKFSGTWLELPVAALWEVAEGQVKLWKDYYDLGQFARMMSSVGIPIDLNAYYEA